MDEKRICEIIRSKGVEQGVATYQSIMKSVNEIDVSGDSDFQGKFRNFYQMRRFYSDDFARCYFDLMETLKNTGREEVSFQMILERVLHFQNSYEISFSSKLLHTIHPSYPIWDNIVTKRHFGINAPSATSKDRIKAIVERYDLYQDRFCEFMCTEEGMRIIHLFDEIFPENGISDVKKIDFVLWQDR